MNKNTMKTKELFPSFTSPQNDVLQDWILGKDFWKFLDRIIGYQDEDYNALKLMKIAPESM